MTDLRACAACHRHIRAADETCPFCEAPARAAAAAKAVAVGVMAAVSVTLAACYGGPPRAENLDNLQRTPRDGGAALPPFSTTTPSK